MTDIQTIKHKKNKNGVSAYATIVVEPTQANVELEGSKLIEKDLHFGLFVLGTEKHESRRIDNQLRGRSGRQGDPGLSQFYVALDDEIMRKMGGDTIKSIAKRLLPADELAKLELTQSQFSNSIVRAQKQMEGYNFSIRKHLFEYDNVVNKQRMRVYGKRDEILHWTEASKDGVLHEIAELIHEVVTSAVTTRSQADQGQEELVETINQIFGIDITEKRETRNKSVGKGQGKGDSTGLISDISSLLVEEWDSKTHIIDDDARLIQIIKSLFLQSIDKYWIEHIDTMHHLREKVGLYGYAQQDPLVIYKQEAFKLYSQLWLMIKMEFLSLLFKIDFTQFHGMEGAVNFDIVDTNDEEFEDNLIGDMDKVTSHQSPVTGPALGTGNRQQATSSSNDVEVIDLSKIQKQPLFTDKKIGPNEPCPCGSGKKYKKCHGKG